MESVTPHKVLNYLEKKIRAGGYEGLARHERTVISVTSFVAEVNNGGFHQYCFNTAGNHNEGLIQGLLDVGADSSIVEEVRAAFALFPDGHPSAERETRMNQIDALNNAGHSFALLEELVHKSSPEIYSRTHSFMWKMFPQLRPVTLASKSEKLIEALSAIAECHDKNVDVVVGGLGKFSARRRLFEPSLPVLEWINGGAVPNIDLKKARELLPNLDLDSVFAEFTSLITILISGEYEQIDLGPFSMWMLKYDKYEGRNPRTGAAIVVPEKKRLCGAFRTES